MNIGLDGVVMLLGRNFKFGDVDDQKTVKLLFAIEHFLIQFLLQFVGLGI